MNGEAEKDTERHNFNGSITEKRSNLFYSEIQKKKANGETELRWWRTSCETMGIIVDIRDWFQVIPTGRMLSFGVCLSVELWSLLEWIHIQLCLSSLPSRTCLVLYPSSCCPPSHQASMSVWTTMAAAPTSARTGGLVMSVTVPLDIDSWTKRHVEVKKQVMQQKKLSAPQILVSQLFYLEYLGRTFLASLRRRVLMNWCICRV